MESESRQKYLSELRNYIEDVDTKVAIILQSFQWIKNTLLEPTETATCKFDFNHIMPIGKLKQHEEKCLLKSKGYSEGDGLPDSSSAPNVVKLDAESIKRIIENAAKLDPLFKRGPRNESQPLRCQTSDEKRAVHDAVVSMMPSHDISDLKLLSERKGSKTMQKSQEEVLAELRNMKRRRTKYRSSVPTHNYSHELRQVISVQMELYAETQAKEIKTEEDIQSVGNVRRPDKVSNHYYNKDNRNDYKVIEKDNYRRKDKTYGESYTKDSMRNKRCDMYDGVNIHKYHGYRSERDSYRSSSRNRKRQSEQYERKDHCSERYGKR